MLGPSSGCVDTIPSMASVSSLLLVDSPECIANERNKIPFQLSTTEHWPSPHILPKIFQIFTFDFDDRIRNSTGESFSVLAYMLYRLSSYKFILSVTVSTQVCFKIKVTATLLFELS